MQKNLLVNIINQQVKPQSHLEVAANKDHVPTSRLDFITFCLYYFNLFSLYKAIERIKWKWKITQHGSAVQMLNYLKFRKIQKAHFVHDGRSKTKWKSLAPSRRLKILKIWVKSMINTDASKIFMSNYVFGKGWKFATLF